jgi:hypothetical protein
MGHGPFCHGHFEVYSPAFATVARILDAGEAHVQSPAILRSAPRDVYEQVQPSLTRHSTTVDRGSCSRPVDRPIAETKPNANR